MNAALRERERFLAVYRAKITAAQEAQLTLVHGQAALERFRMSRPSAGSGSGASTQRRWRPSRTRARSRSDAAAREAQTKVHAIAEHLAGGTAVEAFDAPEAEDAASGAGASSGGASGTTPRPPADRPAAGDRTSRRSGGRRATGGRSTSSTVARGRPVPSEGTPPAARAPTPVSHQASQAPPTPATRPDEASTASLDVPASPASSSLLEVLGGRTGFLLLDDE